MIHLFIESKKVLQFNNHDELFEYLDSFERFDVVYFEDDQNEIIITENIDLIKTVLTSYLDFDSEMPYRRYVMYFYDSYSDAYEEARLNRIK